MDSIQLHLPDDKATRRLGAWLGQVLPPGTTLLLSGNLGSGKTTLVQAIGVGLGIEDVLSSPTFTLINEYTEGRVPLYHVDLYRLSPTQVDQLYLDLYWDGVEVEPGIVAIEWAERLTYRPEGATTITLQPNHKGGRRLTLWPGTQAQANLWETVTCHAVLADEV